MDRYVSLAVSKGRVLQDGKLVPTPDERRRPRIVALDMACRVISPRQLEETALALRIRHAGHRWGYPTYIRKILSPNYRLRSYQAQPKGCQTESLAEFKGTSSYKYTQLPSMRHIRLLQLQPGNKGSCIKCTISAYCLDRELDFVALSYTWGDPTGIYRISCNGLTFHIARNLREALEELRSPKEVLTFWIDALCINQDDRQERETQVKMMIDIYHKASQVYAWIGPEDENSARGFLMLQNICSIAKQFQGDPMSYDELRKAGIPSPEHEDWAAMEALYWRYWWTRVWVVQEICLPQTAIFVCGSARIDARDLFEATLFISQTAIRTTIGLDTGSSMFFHTLRQDHARGEDLGLFRLLIETRSFFATDYRDKVYALLGICSTRDTNATEVNYQKSHEEIYYSLAVYFLNQGSLDILTAVCDPFWRDTQRVMPSWVPDWSMIPRVTEFLHPTTCISASTSNGATADLSFSNDGRLLLSRGILVDRIAHTYKPFLFQSMYERRAKGSKIIGLLPDSWVVGFGGETLMRMGSRLLSWEKFARKLDPYPTGEDSFAVFLQAITAGDDTVELSDLQALYKSYCLVNMFIPPEEGVDTTDFTNSATFSKIFYRASWGRTMFVTKQGYLGIGPYSIRKSDKVIVLKGGKTPFILRQKKERQVLVGECYVHGIMRGEAFGDGARLETFAIS